MNLPKIRAWDKESKFMTYGKLEYFDDSIGYRFRHFTLDSTYEVEFMQSTGLKDKNGVEIYEGDIVEINVSNGFDHMNGKCIVQHSSGHSGLICYHVSSEIEFRIFNDNCNYGYEYEVLGNIHENPELLK